VAHADAEEGLPYPHHLAGEFGTTTVLVEQDVVNSLAISDRAYVMEQGQVVIEGTSEALINDPHIKKAFLGL
jgi:branched-chain amino acid transport system ATP-binding protein